MSVITWYGHSAFKIQCDSSSVLIDPYFAPGNGVHWRDVGAVDLVLITHDHSDHVGDAVEICKSCGAMLGAIVGTAQVMRNRGVPEQQIVNGIGFNIGGTITYRGMAVTMTQAMHSSDSGMPAGYIIKMPDGLVLYHAGDTGLFSAMRQFGRIYGIDLALLPIGGVFTMDALQAAHACRLLNCSRVIPMHWKTFPVLAQNTSEFQKKLGEIAPICQFISMEPGQSRTL
ncbi:MAG: metal-dependent hydrolase [Desulfovibrio sp.]|nr:metal-dependent hydrolase [Desulfovibrio sp.]